MCVCKQKFPVYKHAPCTYSWQHCGAQAKTWEETRPPLPCQFLHFCAYRSIRENPLQRDFTMCLQTQRKNPCRGTLHLQTCRKISCKGFSYMHQQTLGGGGEELSPLHLQVHKEISWAFTEAELQAPRDLY